ncbi:hypothetical protein A2160_02440 [Candidatus Beckwithbacteria bacterium RBG_13_42_9]|uniref:Glycosyltransferase RgtA/B/C/D-like domain-containing protein n=1 Tax=Candidatus Beckwithbacteria bacterium RBG_13_42_9 TaxID=1797457 RepID=A0A1F5E7H0_9BACT|nr:MAG: hypothetical protein A2160_02440 [Candidatus Beckwithbacteria bacterium RBG_13_42_9]
MLFNLFFTLFIWAGLKVIEKSDFKYFLFLIISLIGGLLTKQQMAVSILLLPLFIILAVWRWLKQRNHKLTIKAIIFIVFTLVLLVLGIKYGEVRRIRGFIVAGHNSGQEIPLVQHLVWTFKHTIAEVLPWYWGVFKWLGVVLPRLVNQIQMRLLGLALIGLVVWLIKAIRQKKVMSTWQIGFLGLAAAIYFTAVTLWNWQFRMAYGFPFGVQGRYFFPTIVAHMALIMVGLTSLIPKRWIKWGLFILALWWLILSFIGLWTVVKVYYQVWPLQTLWWQVSQYKPFWFKAEWWFVWLGFYLISLIGMLVNIVRQTRNYEIKES